MKKLSLLLIGIVLATILNAQKDSLTKGPPTEKPKSHYIGVNAGGSTGLGVSYIYWPNKVGVQVSVWPWLTKESTWLSTALTILPTLVSNKHTVLYLFIGNHFIFSDGNDPWYTLGVGPGFQVGNQDVKFHFGFGFAAYNLLNDVSLLPTGEMGLFYNF
jgi:hypothetical protein